MGKKVYSWIVTVSFVCFLSKGKLKDTIQTILFSFYFLVASFQPFSFFLVCRRGRSPTGTCSPACQSCNWEIDHFSYSAFIYRPRLQSIWPVGEESDFRFKVPRTGNRTRDTSSWPRFFPSALSTRPTPLPSNTDNSYVSSHPKTKSEKINCKARKHLFNKKLFVFFSALFANFLAFLSTLFVLDYWSH